MRKKGDSVQELTEKVNQLTVQNQILTEQISQEDAVVVTTLENGGVFIMIIFYIVATNYTPLVVI